MQSDMFQSGVHPWMILALAPKIGSDGSTWMVVDLSPQMLTMMSVIVVPLVLVVSIAED